MYIFGIGITKTKYKDFFKEIIKLKSQKVVFTPNPEILLKTLEDQEFGDMLRKADYLLPDGIGLYLAFQYLENNLPKTLAIIFFPFYILNLFFHRTALYKRYGDRVCGSDLTQDLVCYSEVKKIKVTIIDLYSPEDKNKIKSQKFFRKKMLNKFPNLQFDFFVYNPEKRREIIDKIKKSDSKILFSTLGMKKQEKSIIEIMGKCKNIKLGLGVGSSFDYFTGFQKRAPRIFSDIGVEWLYRIFTSPNKLNRLKRIYNAVFVFMYRVIQSK